MLLTIDIGNTCTKLSIFDEDEQISFGCYEDIEENFRSLLLSFIFKSGLREDQIDGAILSCVVPKTYNKAYDALKTIVKEENIVDINPHKDYGIILDVDNPDEVGDDLIVMCSYAYNLYHQELIIVSMGTCSVICHVTADGKFRHCIIAPGFKKMAETLWKSAAQLPEFETAFKKTYLANNTLDAMNVGIFGGYVGMISSLIKGMKTQLGNNPKVIGCGGLGKQVVPYLKDIDTYDPDFVTKGLNYIYRNYK